MVAQPARPGRRPEWPRESASPAAASGAQTRPKTLEQSLGMPDQERGTGRRGGPGAIKKLPECPPISRTGSRWSPAPPPGLGVTRHGKGYCVPGLGWEEGLRDPHLGGPPGGRGLKCCPRPPPTGERMICRWWAPSGEGREPGPGVGEPLETLRVRGRGQRRLTRGNHPDTRTIALAVGQVAPGFRRAGKRFSLKSWAELRCPSSHPPCLRPTTQAPSATPAPKRGGSLARLGEPGIPRTQQAAFCIWDVYIDRCPRGAPGLAPK